MKCPIDNTELSIQSKEEVVGYCCDECHGIFLKGSGMKAFKVNFETEVLEYRFKNSPNYASELNCPNCKSQMQISLIDEIEIDICQHCQGVWFDKGEAYQTIEENSPISERKKPSFFESLLDFIYYFPAFIALVYFIVDYFFFD